MTLSPFETSDTALAAYLISEGIPEPTIRRESKEQCFYCFPDSEVEIQTFIHSFESGRATGNICIFYRNYKRLLRKVNNGK